ncbi:MAG: methylenetetrahydrofolate reductase [Gammaproteobacteria bacterium]|nr:methylenetetrahydrofolate reductase [Gammaproteobacteria bacterium]
MKKLATALEGNDFVVTCELSPPKGTDLSDLYKKVDSLKTKITAFNLTESATARMTMDPVVAGHFLLQHGIEPIVQFTSRDKNRIAIQSSLLGAAALGVPNVIFMGGDPPKIGDHPDTKPVFDLYTNQMIEAAAALKNGKDYGGNDIKGNPEFLIGSVFNPVATDVDGEVENTRRKIDAGAQFFQTQAIYDVAPFVDFVSRLNAPNVKVLAGIIPIKSVKMATYMNERVPGINISNAMIQRIADAAEKDNIVEESLTIATDTISELKNLCKGIHIMAIGWEKHIPAMLDRSGL